MTITIDFLMLVIALIGCLGGAFAFFTKLLWGIKQDSANTNSLVVELHTEIKNTKEFHTCEFDRVNKKLDDLTEEVSKHEARIIKLENTNK